MTKRRNPRVWRLGLSLAGTLLGLWSLAGLAVGIGGPERLAAISRSLEQARESGAQLYAPQLLAGADERLAAAALEIEHQRRRIFLLRWPFHARALIEEAEQHTREVVKSARLGRALARAEASRSLTQARRAVRRTSELFRRAPLGRDTEADLEGMRLDLHALRRLLARAEEAHAREEWVLAAAWAAEVSQVADRQSERIARAMTPP